MYVREFSKTYLNVSVDAVWRIQTDINNWPIWHGELDYCTMTGPFEVGNFFMLKPKGVGVVKIVLTEVKQGTSFTDCTSFFGAKMYDTHTMEQVGNDVKISNKLVVTGPLQWLWVWLVAKGVADSISFKMEALIALARKSA